MVESALEAAAFLLFEGNPDVSQITEQPLRIPVSKTGSCHTTLDLGTQHLDGTEKFYEIKHVGHLVENSAGELAPPNWDRIQAWALEHGWNIDFISSDDLAKAKYKIHNWRCLLPFVWFYKNSPDPELSFEIYQKIAQSDGLTIQEVTQLTAQSASVSVPYVVADLLHRGKFTANLDKAVFSTNTPVRLAGEDNAD